MTVSDEQTKAAAFARHWHGEIEAIGAMLGIGAPDAGEVPRAVQALLTELDRRSIPSREAVAVGCERCQGNGEIVTDWDRYRRPRAGDVGDEAVAECPDCGGTGHASPIAAAPEGESTKPAVLESSEDADLNTILTVRSPRGDEYVINSHKLAEAFAHILSEIKHEREMGWSLETGFYTSAIQSLQTAALTQEPSP